MRRVISLGVGDYLIKPVNTDRLCARARALATELATGSSDESGNSASVTAPRQPRSERILLPPLPFPTR